MYDKTFLQDPVWCWFLTDFYIATYAAAVPVGVGHAVGSCVGSGITTATVLPSLRTAC